MKPVAWMHQNPNYAISKHQSLEYNIPLYTHPVKELTDDEIIAIVNETLESWNTKVAMLKFARSLLRKAQEK